MNRLQAEFHRLYLPSSLPAQDTAPEEACLSDPEGRVRAMVLELARPADWHALSPVWQGVQADLALPAPAIAVNGSDGYQLWFSLAEPLPVAQAGAFLEALRRRYLGHIAAERLRLLPAAAAPAQAWHAGRVPSLQGATGHWSAFVLPDLAAIFSDEPWLELSPNPEAQADLLSRIGSIAPAALQRALDRLAPAAPPATPPMAQASPSTTSGTTGAPEERGLSPKRFLLAVMRDEAVGLPLRIEAAKALLPYVQDL